MLDDGSYAQLLAEEELVPCVMKIDGTGLGHLEEGSQCKDLEKGARVQLPLWLATALSKKNMVTVHLPDEFSAHVRQDLDAGAMSVNLQLYSRHFFSVGLGLASATGDDALRADVRRALSGERFERLFDWSQNAGEHMDISEITDKLTTDEIRLFQTGYKAASEVQAWKKRRFDKLKTATIFKKTAPAES